MTPNEPQLPVSEHGGDAPPDLPPLPPPPEPWPFWDYADLAFLITLALPMLFLSALVVRAFSGLLQFGTAFQALLAQLLWYLLVFGSLFTLLRARYQRPFWASLGWKIPFRGILAAFFAGPILAIGIGYIGYLLRTPEIQLPFEQMLANRPTLVLFGIFVVILGPLCEELAFRGFLMPLLIRSFGVTAGILLTALVFGGLHAYEYSWSWKHVLLISTAGSVFGWVRYRTGSTAASTFMHSTYNLTEFAAFLLQQSRSV